jgi:hypothetical protein
MILGLFIWLVAFVVGYPMIGLVTVGLDSAVIALIRTVALPTLTYLVFGVGVGGLKPASTLFVTAMSLLWFRMIVKDTESLAVGKIVATILIAIEIIFIVSLISFLVSSFFRHRRAGTNWTASLRESSRDLFMRGARHPLIALGLLEVRLIACAFKTRPDVPKDGVIHLKHRGLDTHQSIFFVLIFFSVIELPVVHLLLRRWSDIAAWIVTVLSLYSLLWLRGLLGAIHVLPPRLTIDGLEVRLGLQHAVNVQFTDIASFELGHWTFAPRIVGLLQAHQTRDATLLLHLKTPAKAHHLFGLNSFASTIALSVEDEAPLLEALQRAGVREGGVESGLPAPYRIATFT